jgi:uncharacterized membrane protein (GlpM family)
LRYLIYSLVGGALIGAIAWLGGRGRTLFASFVAMVPALTLITFIVVHLEGGPLVTRDYARGLLVFLPGWIAYVLFVWLLVVRLGLCGALAGGLALFFGVNLLVLALGAR